MPNNKYLKENYIFGLDIGTRSVVGIVGYKTAGGFNVVAEYVLEHETRAMIDGQIHDVEKVAQTIRKVKNELENKLSMPLKKVCIAAAGRVLKTKSVHVEQPVDQTISIDDDRVYALELLGIELAHQEINKTLGDLEVGVHCVGYTVTKYFLNDYEISKLEGHKGKKIGANILATFLPNEVVESLYKVISDSDLEVESLTLEPIAAIDVAVPANYRLLNIALVDIGAGTSDIAITKDGSVVAFGMIPLAGDEVTETIVHKYLVDFNSAEKIKIKTSGKSKKITYKDIMGIKNTANTEDILEVMRPSVDRLASSIAEKITDLNDGHPTNAVFVVGGGGQLKGFTEILAKYLNIGNDRVALRGKAVLNNIYFESGFKKGPELVTPIGICYSGIDSTKHDFIEVYLNDEPVRVFNTKNLTVMDVAAFKGFSPNKLIAKRGQSLSFTMDGMEKIIKGEPSEPSKILINNEVASLSDAVSMNDYIAIIPAKKGVNAKLTVKEIEDELHSINVRVNNNNYSVKPKLLVNDKLVGSNVNIYNEDVITTENKTVNDIIIEEEISYNNQEILINGELASLSSQVSNNDFITIVYEQIIDDKNEKVIHSSTEYKENNKEKVIVSVNGEVVTLSGKESYVFVDIFDYIDFNLSKPKGNVVCELNNAKASYMEPIKNNDIIKVYWDN